MDKRILIIEDEEQLVMMLKKHLNRHGYIVDAACDGEEGLQKASNQKPDLILLDLTLPKLEGHEVCQILKKNDETKSIPIIILTARDDSINIMKG